MANAKWTIRFSRLGLRLAISAIVIAGTGLTLARYDVLPKLIGFSALLGGGLLAAIAAIVGLTGLIMNLRHRTQTLKTAIIALVLSVPFAAFLISRPMTAGGAPALHDITTDLANPPAFKRLSIRADNLAGVGTVANWRTLHSKAYGDLKPLVINQPAAAVLANAERLAREEGWDVAMVDPVAGQLEATANVSYIRFKDDVVIRVRPVEGGKASIVDVRSVSRVGVGDLGKNAQRIRKFLKALSVA